MLRSLLQKGEQYKFILVECLSSILEHLATLCIPEIFYLFCRNRHLLVKTFHDFVYVLVMQCEMPKFEIEPEGRHICK